MPSPTVDILQYGAEVLKREEGISVAALPGPGPRPLFSTVDYVRKMQTDGMYLGSASNLFWLDLARPAVAGQNVSLHDVKA